jgi:hypothetical protein
MRILTMRGTVLLISHDPSLLETRGLVLKHAGYETVLTDSLEEAQSMILFRTPDLIILCQSLGASAQRRFIAELPKQRISGRVLCLASGPNGPEELLHVCKQLIDGSGTRAQVTVLSPVTQKRTDVDADCGIRSFSTDWRCHSAGSGQNASGTKQEEAKDAMHKSP